MKTAKKITTIATLAFLSITAIFLILTIFSINFFVGVKGSLLISVATLTVAGIFLLNSFNAIERNKVLGYISLSLISISALLVIINSWIMVDTNVFGQIIFSLALTSVIFNLITSFYLKLNKNFLWVQIITYAILSITNIFIILMLFQVLHWDALYKIFWIFLVLSLVSLVILTVISSKAKQFVNEKGFVKIPSEEYLMLKEKAKKLDELMNKETK